jgi:tetratricopeptide (TPR) repeat protein
MQKSAIVLPSLLAAAILVTGCASAPKGDPREAARESEVHELKNTVASLRGTIDRLESRLKDVTDRLEASHSAAQPPSTAVLPHPAHGAGAPVEASASSSDPEAGFVNDTAVGAFRQAMVLFRSEKLSDAILAFSAFLERYPDHALAGSAQFYTGEAYLKMKEYKLAQQEFNRVLTSYDRSPAVPATLRSLAIVQEALKRPEDAAKSRQLLSSLFPMSPAAGHASAPALTATPEAKPALDAAPPAADAPAAAAQSPAVAQPAAPANPAGVDEAPMTAPLNPSSGAGP